MIFYVFLYGFQCFSTICQSLSMLFQCFAMLCNALKCFFNAFQCFSKLFNAFQSFSMLFRFVQWFWKLLYFLSSLKCSCGWLEGVCECVYVDGCNCFGACYVYVFSTWQCKYECDMWCMLDVMICILCRHLAKIHLCDYVSDSFKMNNECCWNVRLTYNVRNCFSLPHQVY